MEVGIKKGGEGGGGKVRAFVGKRRERERVVEVVGARKKEVMSGCTGGKEQG